MAIKLFPLKSFYVFSEAPTLQSLFGLLSHAASNFAPHSLYHQSSREKFQHKEAKLCLYQVAS